MSPNYSAEDSAHLLEFQHFLDGAIHGLRASTRGIGTAAGLLAHKWDERFEEDARGLLHSILNGVTDLNQLTRALADYSMALIHAKPSGQQLPVESALQNALAAVRARIDETGATVYSGPLPRLDADHSQLTILFRCLVTNALEFRDEAAAPRIEITATAAGEEWRFAVSDNGIGIASRFHRQIFEPFERLHSDHRGFGLGLTISRKIVSGYGGRIWVDSREGEGSTFFFTLPKGEAR